MYTTGTLVEWSWSDGSGQGEIVEVFTDKVKRTIKGTEVTRDANKDNPAYLFKQEDGDRVLKSHSEMRPA